MREHDFSETAIHEIGRNAMFVCENPDCNRFTGYETSEGKPRSIAEAAHVLPSGKKGPRAKSSASYPDLKLSSSANGIWLCRICHGKIDNDPSAYPAARLFEWKGEHAKMMRRIVGKDIEAALTSLGNNRRFHQEIINLLSFFDNRRVLFEGMDAECPLRVLDSMDLIRQRLVQAKATIDPSSEVFLMIGSIQSRVNAFLYDIGPTTDLRTLQCNGQDPVWTNFHCKLEELRNDIIVVLHSLAGTTNYRLVNIPIKD